MGFAQGRGRLRQAVFRRLGERAYLNDITEVQVRLKEREEALGFGGSKAIGAVSHIEILGLDQEVDRGDVFSLKDGRQFKVSSEPMVVRSDVRLCPVVEIKP